MSDFNNATNLVEQILDENDAVKEQDVTFRLCGKRLARGEKSDIEVKVKDGVSFYAVNFRVVNRNGERVLSESHNTIFTQEHTREALERTLNLVCSSTYGTDTDSGEPNKNMVENELIELVKEKANKLLDGAETDKFIDKIVETVKADSEFSKGDFNEDDIDIGIRNVLANIVSEWSNK